jgi:iron(III) transport system ATP-binding protein
MNLALEVESVTVRFGAFTAVDAASLGLEPGSIGCLLGPSGCGKTTLLRAIAGFQAVQGGRITVNGRQLSAPGLQVSPEQRRVGMMFQDFALFPHLNVRDNVAFGLTALSRRARRQRADELLELVSLPHSALAWPHELSGGQQQRVALARALAPEPELLLMDEPFSSLDTELRTQLAGEVRDLLIARDVSALLVTHDQDEAFAMADSVTLLNAGRVEQSDSPYRLYHRPASPFVATFIGGGSVIDARVQVTGGLQPDLGPLDLADWPLPTERDLQLLLRPHSLRFAADSTLRLLITDRRFLGAQTLFRLALADGQTVSCLAPGHIEAQRGDTLPVQVSLDDAVFFDDGKPVAV